MELYGEESCSYIWILRIQLSERFFNLIHGCNVMSSCKWHPNVMQGILENFPWGIKT